MHFASHEAFNQRTQTCQQEVLDVGFMVIKFAHITNKAKISASPSTPLLIPTRTVGESFSPDC